MTLGRIDGITNFNVRWARLCRFEVNDYRLVSNEICWCVVCCVLLCGVFHSRYIDLIIGLNRTRESEKYYPYAGSRR